jgi:hypothetical protein
MSSGSFFPCQLLCPCLPLCPYLHIKKRVLAEQYINVPTVRWKFFLTRLHNKLSVLCHEADAAKFIRLQHKNNKTYWCIIEITNKIRDSRCRGCKSNALYSISDQHSLYLCYLERLCISVNCREFIDILISERNVRSCHSWHLYFILVTIITNIFVGWISCPTSW